jgi:O-antigen/teichoic acid export membrane protein
VSTVNRLVSGSVASWLKIGITMLSQLVLVPVYLTYWDVQTYGIWLAIQALVSILSTLDQGHQSYLEFEFLKLGRQKKDLISFNLWSSFWIAIGIGILEVLLVIGFVSGGFTGKVLGEYSAISPSLLHDAGLVLLMSMAVWAVCGNLGGLFVKVLSPFGHYSRMSWWGVWTSLFIAIAPVVSVVMGAGLLQAGIVLTLATIGYAIPQYIDIYRLLKREDIVYRKGSLKQGGRSFILSLVISAKNLMENARQQGVRILLAPLSGAAGLVAFSTMRTGANIALQGLNTITNPLMPELMRFLNAKDQQKMEASFSMVWLVVLCILAPGVIVLQAVISPLFTIWTKGQVSFDPLLFSMLSQGVLVFAVAQPAMSIMRGNNLLRPQFLIAVLSAVIVIGGLFVLVPVYGIRGAGAALLAAEIVATTGYRLTARKWLKEHGLQWPRTSSRLALGGVWFAGTAMFIMFLFPSLQWLWTLLALPCLGLIIYMYWKSLPPIATNKAKALFSKIPMIGSITAYAKRR